MSSDECAAPTPPKPKANRGRHCPSRSKWRQCRNSNRIYRHTPRKSLPRNRMCQRRRLSATLRLCFRQAQNRLRSWRAFGNKSPLRASRQKTVLKKLIGSTYLLFLSYFRAPEVHPNSSFPRFTKKPHGFVRPCGLCPFLRFYRSGSIGRIFATNRHYFLTG